MKRDPAEDDVKQMIYKLQQAASHWHCKLWSASLLIQSFRFQILDDRDMTWPSCFWNISSYHSVTYWTSKHRGFHIAAALGWNEPWRLTGRAAWSRSMALSTGRSCHWTQIKATIFSFGATGWLGKTSDQYQEAIGISICTWVVVVNNWEQLS